MFSSILIATGRTTAAVMATSIKEFKVIPYYTSLFNATPHPGSTP
jgi:hypothetical protein